MIPRLCQESLHATFGFYLRGGWCPRLHKPVLNISLGSLTLSPHSQTSPSSQNVVAFKTFGIPLQKYIPTWHIHLDFVEQLKMEVYFILLSRVHAPSHRALNARRVYICSSTTTFSVSFYCSDSRLNNRTTEKATLFLTVKHFIIGVSD